MSEIRNQRRALVAAEKVEELWTAEEAAAFLRLPVATLYQWRYQRIGPDAFKVGRHLRYDPAVVRRWLSRECTGWAS